VKPVRAFWISGLCVLVLGVAGWVYVGQRFESGSDASSPASGVPADLPAGQSRGEYLTRAADCIACHTTQGGTPFAGGRAFNLPFGTIYSTNLTPDASTGIGNLTDEQFVDAVREGVGPRGHLYPAMPYTSYTALSRDDVLAIRSYLMSLAPVKSSTPANSLRFPFNQRWGMAFWNIAFFRSRRFEIDHDHEAQWNRGAYLATALGHCAECHSPRNFGFAMKSDAFLAGAVLQGWRAYNITSDPHDGIGEWSDAQLHGYLARGHAPGRSSASGPMAEVVQNSLQHLTPGDVDALVSYLKSTPAKTSDILDEVNLAPPSVKSANAILPGDQSTPVNLRGKRLFEADCAGCHRWDGVGRQTPYASLAGSRSVNDSSGLAVMQVLIHGSQLQIVGSGQQSMPAFGQLYTDGDIAAVSNYVLGYFGRKTGRITPEIVAKQRVAE
jgi:mono/diheme cytochrome c family protein